MHYEAVKKDYLSIYLSMSAAIDFKCIIGGSGRLVLYLLSKHMHRNNVMTSRRYQNDSVTMLCVYMVPS